jgi:hypothetical protein
MSNRRAVRRDWLRTRGSSGWTSGDWQAITAELNSYGGALLLGRQVLDQAVNDRCKSPLGAVIGDSRGLAHTGQLPELVLVATEQAARAGFAAVRRPCTSSAWTNGAN